MSYVAKFTWEPHRRVWLHHPSGASVLHWETPEDLDKVLEIARVDVARRRLCEPSEVSVCFDAKTYQETRPAEYVLVPHGMR